MAGATPKGYPYVEPADFPFEYPAMSQQQAQHLESTMWAEAAWTPADSWADQGGAYTGLHVSRSGSVVNISGNLKRTADLVMPAAGTAYTVGQLPAGTAPSGFFPPYARYGSGWLILASTLGAPTPCRVAVLATGAISFAAPVAGTITPAGVLSLFITYRGA